MMLYIMISFIGGFVFALVVFYFLLDRFGLLEAFLAAGGTVNKFDEWKKKK